jgi:hypothetical protein
MMTDRIEVLCLQNRAMLCSIIQWLLAEDDDTKAEDDMRRLLYEARDE